MEVAVEQTPQEQPELTAPALYHPVLGEPLSDPTAQPEVAAEPVAPEQPAAPQFIDVTDEYGNKYTQVAVDRVPEVIRNKDTYIRDLRDQLARYQTAPQPQQPQAPTVDIELEQRAQEIRQEMIAAGFEDNPAFAKFQAKLDVDRDRRAETKAAAKAGITVQQMLAKAEYQRACEANPELSGAENPNTLSGYVYQKYAPQSVAQHLEFIQYEKWKQSQGSAPAPSALPQNVQRMFQQPAPAPVAPQFQQRPPATAAAPQRPSSDPASVTEAIRQTLSFLGVTADSPRGQRAIAEIRATANGGVR